MAKKPEDAAARADALIAKYGSAGRTGPTCSVANHPERDLIDAMLARHVQYNHLSRTIANEFAGSARLSAESLSRHHKRICQCPR